MTFASEVSRRPTEGAVEAEKENLMSTFDEAVYEYVKRVPRGKVTTYGTIARAVGRPRASRLVGNALHRNPTPVVVPCHRVVNREGRLAPAFAFGGMGVQAQLLEAEGVTVEEGYVDLKTYFWDGASLT